MKNIFIVLFFSILVGGCSDGGRWTGIQQAEYDYRYLCSFNNPYKKETNEYRGYERVESKYIKNKVNPRCD